MDSYPESMKEHSARLRLCQRLRKPTMRHILRIERRHLLERVQIWGHTVVVGAITQRDVLKTRWWCCILEIIDWHYTGRKVNQYTHFLTSREL